MKEEDTLGNIVDKITRHATMQQVCANNKRILTYKGRDWTLRIIGKV